MFIGFQLSKVVHDFSIHCRFAMCQCKPTVGPWPRQTPSIRKSSSYFPTLRNLPWTMPLAIMPAMIPEAQCDDCIIWLFLSECWRAHNHLTVNDGIIMNPLKTWYITRSSICLCSNNQITVQLLQGHEFDGFVDVRDLSLIFLFLLLAVGHVQRQFMAVPQARGTPLLAKHGSKANYEIGALTASSWSAIWACVWHQFSRRNLISLGSSVQFQSPCYVCLRWWNRYPGSPEFPLQCFRNPSKLSARMTVLISSRHSAGLILFVTGETLHVSTRCHLYFGESRYRHLVVVFIWGQGAKSSLTHMARWTAVWPNQLGGLSSGAQMRRWGCHICNHFNLKISGANCIWHGPQEWIAKTGHYDT